MKLGKRVNFNVIKNELAQKGKAGARLAPSTLILAQNINTARTKYKFDVLENEGTPAAEEIRLNINDDFICTEIGIYLRGQETTVGARVMNAYYPFAHFGQVAGAEEALPLWDGTLDVSVNNTTYIQGWDVRKHWVSPINLANLTAANTVEMTGQSSLAMEHDGMVALEPMITLSGAKKNTIDLNLPGSISGYTVTMVGGTPVAIVVNGITVIMRGMLAQNTASFQ